MCGFIFIFLLSTLITQQSDGTKNLKRMLTAPAHHYGNKNNFYNLYDDRAEDWSDDDEQDFKDETRYGDQKYDNSDEVDNEYGSRRLFEWFSRLFKSTTPHAQAETTTESVYTKELKERIFLNALHRNLTHILLKLSEVEKQVSYAMDQKEEFAILTKGKPKVLGKTNGFYFGDRKKREINKTAEDDRRKRDAKIDNDEGHRRNIQTNIATAAGHRRKREAKIDTTVGDSKKRDRKMAIAEGERRKRDTSKATEELTKTVTEKSKEVIDVNTTECPCNLTSGRRLGSMPTPTEVKNKLLLYLQESFQEIKGKILSLRNLKQAFSDNISFKIGYILANIDTLEVSMLNLKNNMDKNKELWQDNKILDLYDTLKVSNQAVSGLIDSLKSYLEKLSYPQVKPQLNLA